MPKYHRLICKVPLSSEQPQAIKYLMDSEGLCTCGRFLKSTDAKLCLAQVNTAYFADPKGRNLLLIAAYCFDCAQKINNTLMYIRRLAKPDADQRRAETGQ